MKEDPGKEEPPPVSHTLAHGDADKVGTFWDRVAVCGRQRLSESSRIQDGDGRMVVGGERRGDAAVFKRWRTENEEGHGRLVFFNSPTREPGSFPPYSATTVHLRRLLLRRVLT